MVVRRSVVRDPRRNTMEWLMAVSSLVAKEGQSMAWITPLGLPVIQPYRQRNTYQVTV